MSSYISPAPQGDPKATGAYAVAIAATSGSVNNDGHATDSAGNVAVDQVWGNFPLQPNDVRRVAASNFGGARGSDVVTITSGGTMQNVPGKDADYGWSATTMVASDNLAYGNLTKSLNNGITFAVKPDSHELAESGYSGYPANVRGNQAVYIITQATGNGSTQTYTAPNNFLKAGDTVNITGTGLDGNSLTVATANRYTFTVSASGTGTYINISGRVRYTDEVTANDGSYVSGVAYVRVPSVLGFTTASAVDVMTDVELIQTTASAATNTATQPTRINVTATDTATVYVSGGTSTWPVGTKVTIAAGTGIPAALVGTWTVTGGSGSTLVITGSGWTVADTSSITPGTRLTGTSGTIKSQSIAAGTGSIAAGAAVTITPWA
jgi:hypothetical protein